MQATLGIDVGTSNTKAAIVDAAGRALATAGVPYRTHHLGPGLVEQDAEDWWSSTCMAVRTALAQLGGGITIVGIGVSGQGCALTPVDADGRALRRAIIWMDTRSEPQCVWIRAHAAAAIHEANGNLVAPYNVDPKILWLRQNEPETYAAAHCFLTTTAYVTQRLSGAFVANRSDGGILFSYDLTQGDWSDAVLEAIGVPRARLPALAASHAVAGPLRSSAAEELGIPAGVPVVAGGEDTSSAALAAGVVAPRQSYLSLGTAGVVGICLDRPLPQPRLLSFPHVVEGITLLSGSMSSTGASLHWFLRELGGMPADSVGFQRLGALAEGSAPGAGGLVFLPYMTGELHPILDPFARGTFIGLSLSTTRGDMVRAMMEGAACAIRHNLDAAREVGACLEELRATGGPSSSAVWCQIIADVTGLPVLAMDDAMSGAPVGNALLAAMAAGLVEDLTAAAQERARVGREYYPRNDLRERYDALYGIYIRSYAKLKDEYPILAELPG